MTSILILLVLSLMLVFYQDLKYRHIHVVLPVAIFLFSVFIFKDVFSRDFTVVFYNALFVLLTLFLLVFYMSLKNREFLNPFSNYFGLGDLLFFLAVTPLFLTYNYILYFIFSMLFSVFLRVVFVKMMKVSTIPLAGFSALFLVLIIGKDLFLNFNKITIL